ncbi:hypothetical protein J6590_051225 [Homalodisca vitripennis]|nr:hypothetical protein J6590_051225 [Homalodisca vitripennis]
MSVPSIYRNFRPLMVFHYILGQFTSTNVLGETSENLNFNYCTVPVLSFILQSLITIKWNVTFLTCRFKDNTFIIVHDLLSVAVDLVVIGWLLLGSRDLIRSFKIIDDLRNILSKMTSRTETSNLSVFGWLTLTTGVVFQMVFSRVSTLGMGATNFQLVMQYMFSVCFFFRACLTLISLFYCCSIIIRDSIRVWRNNRDANPRHLQSPEEFCHLLMKFAPLFDDLQKTLSLHVLAVMLYFNYGVLNDSVYHAYADDPLAGSLVKIMSWCGYLGLLIVCVALKSDQYERLSEEIFTTLVSHLPQRELMKLRLLVSQCDEGSRDFAAAGFVIVVPQLFLVFLSFAIDYYILCEQNMVYLREVTGITGFCCRRIRNRRSTTVPCGKLSLVWSRFIRQNKTFLHKLSIFFLSFAIDYYILCEQNMVYLREVTGITLFGPKRALPIEARAQQECRWPSGLRRWTLSLKLEIAQVRILSVTIALFISTIDLVLYRLSLLFCLIRSSHRPVAHEDGQEIGFSLKK